MAIYKFKTSMACQGCVSSVTPFLDELSGIDSWKVDTNNESKILEVNSSTASPSEIKAKVQEAGFSIDEI